MCSFFAVLAATNHAVRRFGVGAGDCPRDT